jgi:hypothetical protein
MAMEEWEGSGGARENSVASFRQKADVPADVKTAFLKRQKGFGFDWWLRSAGKPTRHWEAGVWKAKRCVAPME